MWVNLFNFMWSFSYVNSGQISFLLGLHEKMYRTSLFLLISVLITTANGKTPVKWTKSILTTTLAKLRWKYPINRKMYRLVVKRYNFWLKRICRFKHRVLIFEWILASSKRQQKWCSVPSLRGVRRSHHTLRKTTSLWPTINETTSQPAYLVYLSSFPDPTSFRKIL